VTPRTTLSFSGALIGLLTETCRDHRRVLGQLANGCPLGIPDWPSSPCRGFSGLGPIGPMVLGPNMRSTWGVASAEAQKMGP
jgi:hypothetical protein